ncbi:MAG: C45 family peptidase [Actinomycetota bacterium]
MRRRDPSAVAFDDDLPAGRTRDEQLALAARYRDLAEDAMPWAIEEIDAAAEAAGVDPVALFACHVEEIWYEPRAHGGPAIDGRCSDLVAVAPATADGHTLVAHNNDMYQAYGEELVAIERRADDDPAVFTIGNGIWISVGWNDAGLSLTGNELSPNDERIGIPRELQVRAMLRERSLEAMVGTALRHDRASSYNNVLAAADGSVVNVEGSATAAELTEPDDDGRLVHTNHYVCDSMLGYEGDPAYAERSAIRYRRAWELLSAAAPGSVDAPMLRTILSDHEHAPDSICRHAHEAHVGDVLLVHRGRERRSHHVRPRQPLRLDRAGVRVRGALRLTASAAPGVDAHGRRRPPRAGRRPRRSPTAPVRSWQRVAALLGELEHRAASSLRAEGSAPASSSRLVAPDVAALWAAPCRGVHPPCCRVWISRPPAESTAGDR